MNRCLMRHAFTVLLITALGCVGCGAKSEPPLSTERPGASPRDEPPTPPAAPQAVKKKPESPPEEEAPTKDASPASAVEDGSKEARAKAKPTKRAAGRASAPKRRKVTEAYPPEGGEEVALDEGLDEVEPLEGEFADSEEEGAGEYPTDPVDEDPSGEGDYEAGGYDGSVPPPAEPPGLPDELPPADPGEPLPLDGPEGLP